MPVFTRPDAEIRDEVHGSGFPLLLFATGGLRSQLKFWRHSPGSPDAPPPWMNPMVDLVGRFAVIGMNQRRTPLLLLPGSDEPHPAETSADNARLAPNLKTRKDRRGPTHLAESIRRVTDFLTRNTPTS